RHPVTGERVRTPGTPGEWRSVANSRAELRRGAGASSRGEVHVDGDRRRRKPKAARMSGFTVEKAAHDHGRYVRWQQALARDVERLLNELAELNPRRDRARAMAVAREVVNLQALVHES